MPDYEQTTNIDAEPDDLFDYLADARHMPEFLPIPDEEDIHGERIVIEEEVHGAAERTHGWVHVDDLERRMEWGAQDGRYHGWLQVDPGDLQGSVVTIHVFDAEDDPESRSEAEAGLSESVENIRRGVAT